jgi:hypothetical protein
MKPVLLALFACIMHNAIAQTTESFHLISFSPPGNWTASAGNEFVRQYMIADSVNNTYCVITIYGAVQSTGNIQTDFTEEWKTKILSIASVSGNVKTSKTNAPAGYTFLEGSMPVAMKDGSGKAFMDLMVINLDNKRQSIAFASGSEKMMRNYVKDIRSFVVSIQKSGDPVASTEGSTVNTEPSSPPAGNISISDYKFIAPERWYGSKGKDYILLQSASSPERGCLIGISAPQASSGNLENDAKNIFNQLYAGWQYRFTGEKHDVIAKGISPQGYEFCMVEASMQKPRPDGYYYDYEKGSVYVIRVGKQIIIITGRHERGEMVCFCDYQYEYWRRFFNSFAVNNYNPSKEVNDNSSKRIIGSWQSIGGSALVKYIFAGNGQYAFIGAYSTTRRIDYSTVELKTSGFKGDGSYALKGSQMILTKAGSEREVMQYRLEQVNHSSAGWTDRLYILAKSTIDGKDYEVCYEKQPG